jgi:hypothetical protein
LGAVPVINFLLDLVFLVAIALLELALELFALASDLIEVVISEFALVCPTAPSPCL